MLRTKTRILCIVTLLLLTLMSACSSAKYKDGVYTAQAPEFASSGWKETMEVTVEKGKVSKINWDAIYKDDSIPIRKKQYSKSGLYGMLKGGAKEEWYDQATAVEQYVLENGIDALILKDGGYTDSVASCSIHVNAFEELYRECLKQAEK